MSICARKCATSQFAASSVRCQRIVHSRLNRRPVRRVLVRADGEKETKEAPHKKAEGGLPAFLKPLTDFGVGKTSVWEGGVGLFMLVGAGITGALIAWVSGLQMNKGRGYECSVQFPEACSITVGTPVRLRGIQVGSVLNVQPHLDRVDVLIQVDDEHTVIPRNSRLYANQSGLIAEPLVDIMPQDPIPEYTASPLSDTCKGEGAIVCHRGTILGEKGVSLDDLVYATTKIMRQMDSDGLEAMISAADTVSQAVADAKPLVESTTKLIDQVHPLLKELREAGLVEHVEALASLATDTAGDVRKLQTSVLDDENIKELKKSIKTLTSILRNIESVSGDVAGLSGDSGAHATLKQLIDAFSRLVAD